MADRRTTRERIVSKDRLKDLGAYIRDLRKAKGWTMRDLSKQSGVPESYLQNIEAAYAGPGRMPATPRDSLLNGLAEALDTNVTEFHQILGRAAALEYLHDPDAVRIAEAYAKMPPIGRKIIDDARKTAEDIVRQMECEKTHGTLAKEQP